METVTAKFDDVNDDLPNYKPPWISFGENSGISQSFFIPSLRRTAPSAEARSEFLALLKRPVEHVLPTWIYHGTTHCFICIYIYVIIFMRM